MPEREYMEKKPIEAYEKVQDGPPQLEERVHVNCRRCKEPTFSLKTRTCSKCGYPKGYFTFYNRVKTSTFSCSERSSSDGSSPIRKARS